MTMQQTQRQSTGHTIRLRPSALLLLRADLKEHRLEAVRDYSQKHMPTHRYHNYAHIEDVVRTCDRLADSEGVATSERQLLKAAAYLHDIIYIPFGKRNEEASADLAGELLPKLGYSRGEVEQVKSMILATKLPTTPRNLLERIICDADLDNFGREDFLERCEDVRKELGIEDRIGWLQGTLQLMMSHRYYTDSAKSERDPKKAENMQAVIKLIEGSTECLKL